MSQPLTVGAAHDPAEAAADRAADAAVARLFGGGTIHRSHYHSADHATPGVVGASGGAAPTAVVSALATPSAGRPLPTGVRRKMESAMNADFSAVRIHTGPQAAALNSAVSARAFTADRNIYFRDGLPDTSIPAGARLLAHELSHSAAHETAIRRSFTRMDGETLDTVAGTLRACGLGNKTDFARKGSNLHSVPLYPIWRPTSVEAIITKKSLRTADRVNSTSMKHVNSMSAVEMAILQGAHLARSADAGHLIADQLIGGVEKERAMSAKNLVPQNPEFNKGKGDSWASIENTIRTKVENNDNPFRVAVDVSYGGDGTYEASLQQLISRGLLNGGFIEDLLKEPTKKFGESTTDERLAKKIRFFRRTPRDFRICYYEMSEMSGKTALNFAKRSPQDAAVKSSSKKKSNSYIIHKMGLLMTAKEELRDLEAAKADEVRRLEDLDKATSTRLVEIEGKTTLAQSIMKSAQEELAAYDVDKLRSWLTVTRKIDSTLDSDVAEFISSTPRVDAKGKLTFARRAPIDVGYKYLATSLPSSKESVATIRQYRPSKIRNREKNNDKTERLKWDRQKYLEMGFGQSPPRNVTQTSTMEISGSAAVDSGDLTALRTQLRHAQGRLEALNAEKSTLIEKISRLSAGIESLKSGSPASNMDGKVEGQTQQAIAPVTPMKSKMQKF